MDPPFSSRVANLSGVILAPGGLCWLPAHPCWGNIQILAIGVEDFKAICKRKDIVIKELSGEYSQSFSDVKMKGKF